MSQVAPPTGNEGVWPSCRVFSAHERLCAESKYYCEQCCSKQEATKRLRVKRLPLILALHLKRFKYMEHFNKFVKLSHRVAFPWELKLFNIVSDQITSTAVDVCACSLEMLRILTTCMT